MPAYSVGLTKAGVNTANTVMWQVRSNARVCRILEVAISIGTAPTTAPLYVLARSTATGTVSTSVAGQAHLTNDVAAVTLLESAWSVAPSFNTAGPFHRALGLPVTAGSGWVWTWPVDKPLILLANTGLCIANLNATGATLGLFATHVMFEE